MINVKEYSKTRQNFFKQVEKMCEKIYESLPERGVIREIQTTKV